MENASKALIIAGAILLSILIIAIGMYIYNSSQSTIINAGSQMSEQEIANFNSQWEMYEGTQTGAQVRSLISKMISNANTNKEEDSRLPDLVYQPTNNSTTCCIVSTVGNTNVTLFNSARQSIQARHNYQVLLNVNPETSLIETITVNY